MIDKFLIAIDSLVILFYLLLIVILTPSIMRFIRNIDRDIFFQLIPLLSLILASSIAISVGYGGFSETIFFQIISILSSILLLGILFLTLYMKRAWPENYEKFKLKVTTLNWKQLFPKK